MFFLPDTAYRIALKTADNCRLFADCNVAGNKVHPVAGTEVCAAIPAATGTVVRAALTTTALTNAALTIAIRAFIVAALLLLWPMPAQVAAANRDQPPTIAVSIKPLHSLVSAVTDGVTEPVLLLDGFSSPHTTPLKPSTRRHVQNADIVVWVGAGVEVFLARIVENLILDQESRHQKSTQQENRQQENGLEESGQTHVVTFSQIEGLQRWPFRIDAHGLPHSAIQKHTDSKDNHDEQHQHSGHTADGHAGDDDFHYWLDPRNAMRLVQHLSAVLAERDPANAERYARNTESLLQKLRDVDQELDELLAGLSGISYLVFHDSFQYLERRYNLHRALVIAEQPEVSPGARRLKKILRRIEAENVKCLFTEPQFPARVVTMLQRDSSVDLATLDPLASDFDAGPDLYPQWILQLGQTIHGCLAGGE